MYAAVSEASGLRSGGAHFRQRKLLQSPVRFRRSDHRHDEYKPSRCQRPPHDFWRSSGAILACSAVKKSVGNSYQSQRARHVKAAREGSIVRYWTSWHKWQPFKVVWNLKMLASVFDSHHLDERQLEQICPSISAALKAHMETFSNAEVSFVLMYLSRLQIVPQEFIWRGLVDKLGTDSLP